MPSKSKIRTLGYEDYAWINKMRKGTFGLIIGHRERLPVSMAEKGRREIVNVLKEQGFEIILLPANETKHGTVENANDAKKYASLFRKNSDKIEGILVSLPDFGDESAVADTIRLSELKVPVLIHAFPEQLERMEFGERRDSFCGKISVCNNLKQYGIPFSLTRFHTVSPSSPDFIEDLKWFTGVCRVMKGLRHARVGMIGARITKFKTVRYSEKLLESYGISVETADLSEIFAQLEKIKDFDERVKLRLKELTEYCKVPNISKKAFLRMARLGVVLEKWAKENGINAFAVQCWPNIQEFLQIFPCAVMSMMNESLLPAVCETDVMSAVAVYALQMASGSPSGLFDWNNNYGKEPDKLVFFHCSNAPKSLLMKPCITYNPVAANAGLGKENSYGTCWGRVKTGPFTFSTIATDDRRGKIIACIGEGEFTSDPLETYGGVGVAEIKGLQKLLGVLCKNGFGHHVAINLSSVSDILFEVMDTYLGWEVFYHNKRDLIKE